VVVVFFVFAFTCWQLHCAWSLERRFRKMRHSCGRSNRGTNTDGLHVNLNTEGRVLLMSFWSEVRKP
jgi:hypothetical protein